MALQQCCHLNTFGSLLESALTGCTGLTQVVHTKELRSNPSAMRRGRSPLVRQRPLTLCSIALLLVLSACGPHARYDLLLCIVSCCLIEFYSTGYPLVGTLWTKLVVALFPPKC